GARRASSTLPRASVITPAMTCVATGVASAGAGGMERAGGTERQRNARGGRVAKRRGVAGCHRYRRPPPQPSPAGGGGSSAVPLFLPPLAGEGVVRCRSSFLRLRG